MGERLERRVCLTRMFESVIQTVNRGNRFQRQRFRGERLERRVCLTRMFESVIQTVNRGNRFQSQRFRGGGGGGGGRLERRVCLNL